MEGVEVFRIVLATFVLYLLTLYFMVDKKTVFKIVLLCVMAAAILALLISFFIAESPTSKWLLDFLEYISRIPKVWGALLMTLIYTIALLFILPGTPFNLGAGFLFGFWIGTLVTVVGCCELNFILHSSFISENNNIFFSSIKKI